MAKAKRPSAAKGRPADPVVATSARDLADLVGRSHTAVNRWLKDERWTFGGGPWRAGDVARITAGAAAELVDRPAGGGAAAATPVPADPAAAAGVIEQLSVSKRADVALKLTRRQVLQFGLEVQQGKYHPVDNCKVQRLRAIHEVRQGLLNLADSIPTDPDTRTVIRGRVTELLRRFAAGMGVHNGGDPSPATNVPGHTNAVPAAG